MSERFTRISKEEDLLYTEGSPVIILASAILKDNFNEKILQQVKYINYSPKKVIAIFVSIKAYSITGDKLKGIEDFQYLDLKVSTDNVFGYKTPVYLPDRTTRKTNVKIKKVLFEDGSSWEADSNAEWLPIKSSTSRTKFEDRDLEDQFILEYGKDYRFQPERFSDLWYCACGTLNKLDDKICKNCGRNQSVLDGIDLDKLEEDKKARLEAEAAKAEQERLEAEEIERKWKEENEILKRKSKKFALIGGPIIVAVIIFLVCLFNVIIPNIKYSNACSLMEQGNYVEALATFKEIENTNDSQSLIFECEKNVLKSASVGDVVTFGKENGTFIEWTVLENDNGVVLIAKNTIDTNTSVKHGECADILNGYIQSYFTDSERAIIADDKLILPSRANIITIDPSINNYWLSDFYTETKTTGSGYSKKSVTYNGFYYVTTSGNVSQTTKLSDTCCVRAAAYINLN